MIKLGNIQTLQVKRLTKIGAFLNEAKPEMDDVRIPLSQLPKQTEVGDDLSVFVYKDSEDRFLATTKTPAITLGKIAMLRVVDKNPIGAFLDMGLEKELFLPFKEQIGAVTKGMEVLVAMYLDGTDRLCATMNVYEVLKTDSPYKEQDQVTGTLYRVHPVHGGFVAVDNIYHGRIPTKDLFGTYEEGKMITCRVNKVHPDGKLELRLRGAAHEEMDGDSERVWQKIIHNHGTLMLHDKSDPQLIKKELNMSKASFKRAIGKLYKEGRITIESDHIRVRELDK